MVINGVIYMCISPFVGAGAEWKVIRIPDPQAF
jgi:hypothetical protein